MAKSDDARQRLRARTTYQIDVWRWHARYGLGSMMPDDPELDESLLLQLQGQLRHPPAYRGRVATIGLRFERFAPTVEDIDKGGASIGHLAPADGEIRGEMLLPWESMSSLATLVSSGRVQAVLLRGTGIRDGKCLLFQIELDTRPRLGEPELEER